MSDNDEFSATASARKEAAKGRKRDERERKKRKHAQIEPPDEADGTLLLSDRNNIGSPLRGIAFPQDYSYTLEEDGGRRRQGKRPRLFTGSVLFDIPEHAGLLYHNNDDQGGLLLGKQNPALSPSPSPLLLLGQAGASASVDKMPSSAALPFDDGVGGDVRQEFLFQHESWEDRNQSLSEFAYARPSSGFTDARPLSLGVHGTVEMKNNHSTTLATSCAPFASSEVQQDLMAQPPVMQKCIHTATDAPPPSDAKPSNDANDTKPSNGKEWSFTQQNQKQTGVRNDSQQHSPSQGQGEPMEQAEAKAEASVHDENVADRAYAEHTSGQLSTNENENENKNERQVNERNNNNNNNNSTALAVIPSSNQKLQTTSRSAYRQVLPNSFVPPLSGIYSHCPNSPSDISSVGMETPGRLPPLPIRQPSPAASEAGNDEARVSGPIVAAGADADDDAGRTSVVTYTSPMLDQVVALAPRLGGNLPLACTIVALERRAEQEQQRLFLKAEWLRMENERVQQEKIRNGIVGAGVANNIFHSARRDEREERQEERKERQEEREERQLELQLCERERALAKEDDELITKRLKFTTFVACVVLCGLIGHYFLATLQHDFCDFFDYWTPISYPFSEAPDEDHPMNSYFKKVSAFARSCFSRFPPTIEAHTCYWAASLCVSVFALYVILLTNLPPLLGYVWTAIAAGLIFLKLILHPGVQGVIGAGSLAIHFPWFMLNCLQAVRHADMEKSNSHGEMKKARTGS